ncbi:hypothetical protein BGZ89_011673 [Linnemannia elongata]|nr:hypothetical protein BGZ89_011673 [Linnemannia elongata]
MCSLYSINNNSKFSGQSSFQVVLCAKDSSPSSPRHSPISSISSSAPCSPYRRKKMKGGAKSPILILTPSSSSNQQLQEITALFSPPSFQSTTQSSLSPSTSSSSPSPSNNNPSSAAHYRANSNSSTISPSSLSYQQQQQQRRRQGSNHGTSHWHQFHQHQHHHQNSFDASFENDQENHHPYSTAYAHKRASFPIDQHSNNSFYHNKRSSGANSNGIRGRDTGNARSAQVLNPTNLQIHSKTFFPSQSTPTPTHSSSTTLLLSAQQQQDNHSSSISNSQQPQQQRRPVATQLADPAVISFAAAAAASVSGVGVRGGTCSSMPTSPSSSTLRSPGSSPIRQTSVQGGSHTAWGDMKSFPSDRAIAAATTMATASSSLTLSTLPTMTGTASTTTPVATPAAEKGRIAHGSQAKPRDRSPLASSVDSHGHSTFDSDEMDLQHLHSDSNIDSDASMTEADNLDLDSAASLQLMQAIHPHHSLEQKQQQSQHKTINYRHSLNHHFNQHFPLLSSASSSSAVTAANTAAVAATAAAVATAAATAAAASSTKDAESPLERKSHLRRKCDRLQVKNAALKATVIQVKSDLALERQKRSTVDQIYLNIRKDLNQRLESEEDKVLSLKADLEQMAAEMKELKDQLASARTRSTPFSTSASMSSLSGLNSRSVSGYRIGYDSSAFSLSRGISTFGGVLMPHNSSLIDGQDDSEEFMVSHSYSPSTRRTSASQLDNGDSTLMSCSDDEADDDDEEMEEEDESDDESCAVKGAFLFKQPPVSRRGSSASSMSLRTLTEETIEEEEEEDDDDEELDEEDEVDSDLEDHAANKDENDYSDAPRTMMEIILQRQQSHSPEDDTEDPPADANETFESMVQKALFHAIHSRLTVAQAQLQIEELVLKYNVPLEKTIEAITQGMLRWWETERMATGGSASGGFGTDAVVINKETGEQAIPKVAIEKRIESFFGPLLLQFVASIDEQKMLLEKLGEQAQAEPEGRWLRNHNGILVALYKYDVLDGEAVLEWWRALEEPQGVFGHGENNLRSLNSRFAAWLEDEDEESDSESELDEDDDTEEDSDSDSSCSEFESDSEDDDNDDDDYLDDEEEGDDNGSADAKDVMDQDVVVEAILDVAFPGTPSPPTPINRKDQDGKVQQKPARKAKSVDGGGDSKDGDDCEDGEDEEEEECDDDAEDSGVAKKKYDQCPPFKGIIDRDIEIGTMA